MLFREHPRKHISVWRDRGLVETGERSPGAKRTPLKQPLQPFSGRSRAIDPPALFSGIYPLGAVLNPSSIKISHTACRDPQRLGFGSGGETQEVKEWNASLGTRSGHTHTHFVQLPLEF